jgi:hypothetical protein
MTTLTLRDLGFIGGLGGYDADALTYITAVETADGQSLEVATKDAINAFVVGCKLDGIWNAIKASCIMAGARTLAGALVPLVGTAPTNFNFVSGDYNRKTGLVGNGSTKYLNSNRYLTSDPQDSQHLAVYHNSTAVGISVAAGTASLTTSLTSTQIIMVPGPFSVSRSINGTNHGGSAIGVGIYGVSRGSSASYTWRASGGAVGGTVNQTSTPSYFQAMYIFARCEANGTVSNFTSSRLAFYSIGENLDLAQLDARVSALITAIGAAF